MCEHDPVEIMAFITNRCNLSCFTCPFMRPSLYSPEPDVPDLSPQLFEAILDEYPGVERVGIVGGEPLLHPQWADLIRIAAGRHMEINLATNGLLLTDDTIREILNLPIGFLNVSLDAATSDEYRRMRGGSNRNYELIRENIRRFTSARARSRSGIRVVLSHVTDAQNLVMIPEFARLAVDLGADQVFCQNMLPYCSSELTGQGCSLMDTEANRAILASLELPGGIDVALPRLIVQEDKTRSVRCKHPFRMLTIDGAGNLSPCCVLPPHSRYGSLADDMRQWRQGQTLRGIRKDMIRGGDAFADICMMCGERFTL